VSPLLCDFCNGGPAAYALDCDAVAMRATGAHGVAVAALSGDWHCCSACLPFIERADPDGLADFVARAAHGPPELLRMTSEAFRSDVFKALYRKVLPWLGSPQPLGREAVGVGAPNRGQLATTDGC